MVSINLLSPYSSWSFISAFSPAEGRDMNNLNFSRNEQISTRLMKPILLDSNPNYREYWEHATIESAACISF